MAYQYTFINGQRVEKNVAKAFKEMASAFLKATGCELLVTSGTRTTAEQQRLYNGWINRLPGYNLAARPGTSNHEENGPIGPRALDLRDSGRDAGVTRFGTRRGNWLAANASRFGFKQAGASFNPREAWHYEYTGRIGSYSSGSSSAYNETVKRVQAKLKAVYPLYAGKLVVDGINGPKTIAAVKEFQRRSGITVDGIIGPVTLKKLGL